MKTNSSVLLACMFLLFLDGLKAQTPGGCPEIAQGVKARVVEYVHGRFNVPHSIPLKVDVVNEVSGTCYVQLRIQSDDRDKLFTFTLFLSPDHRFLSRELIDTSLNWREEQRRNERRLISALQQSAVPTRGPVNAPVQITVFSDYQCAYCRETNSLIKKLEAENPENYRISWRHLPSPNREWSRAAAEVAACVHSQSDAAFWALHEFLFANQRVLTVASLRPKIDAMLRSRSDIKIPGYLSCLDDVSQKVKSDLELGRQHNVRATPTMFVNGKRVEGVWKEEDFRAMIEHIMRTATSSGEN